MNQDVLNIQPETAGVTLTDRLCWDWRNPLIAFPLVTVGIILASVLAILLG